MKRFAFVSLLCLATLMSVSATAGTTDDANQDYAERMAEQHAHDNAQASPAALEAPAAEVEGQAVVYATVEGKEIHGYLAQQPGAENAPGLIVIHEWWGLNENVEAMARRLAGEGYRALAVDLYAGAKAENPEGARDLMQASMEHPEQLLDNLRQAHTFLRSQGSTRIGSIGWCFGGGWSLQSAITLGGELNAAVIYYGRLITDADALQPIQAPVLGVFGADDQGIPVDSVHAFEAAMKAAGKAVEVHVYDGANHGFANPSGQRYNPEAAADAWAKTTAFFATHLKS